MYYASRVHGHVCTCSSIQTDICLDISTYLHPAQPVTSYELRSYHQCPCCHVRMACMHIDTSDAARAFHTLPQLDSRLLSRTHVPVGTKQVQSNKHPRCFIIHLYVALWLHEKLSRINSDNVVHKNWSTAALLIFISY